MTQTSNPVDDRNLDWLVSRFVGDVSDAAHAILVSADGLLMAASDSIPREQAEHVAAVSSGLASLGVGAARLLDGGTVLQTIVEMERGYLLLMGVGDGSYLTVLTAPGRGTRPGGVRDGSPGRPGGPGGTGATPSREGLAVSQDVPDDQQATSPTARYVRPYTITSGRTRTTVDLPLEATLLRQGHDEEEQSLAIQRVLEVCHHRSVAEVAALCSMPVGVVRVLLGDLIEQGIVRLQTTITENSTDGERIELIERTLRGLRNY